MLLGVFDGHGEQGEQHTVTESVLFVFFFTTVSAPLLSVTPSKGHLVSQYAANRLKKNVLKQQNKNLQLHDLRLLHGNFSPGASLANSTQTQNHDPDKPTPVSLRSALTQTAGAIARGCVTGIDIMLLWHVHVHLHLLLLVLYCICSHSHTYHQLQFTVSKSLLICL
jgi:hypothetical protein